MDARCLRHIKITKKKKGDKSQKNQKKKEKKIDVESTYRSIKRVTNRYLQIERVLFSSSYDDGTHNKCE